MRLLVLIICCLLPSFLFSQNPTRYFPLPGPPEYYIWGYCAPVLPTSDGGYLLNYGYARPGIHAGTGYGQLIKTDSSFVPQWRLPLRAESGRNAFAYSDGSAIVISNGIEIGIQKVDLSGQNIWNQRIYRDPEYTQVITNLLEHDDKIELIGYLAKFDWMGIYLYTAPMILELDTAGNFVRMDSLEILGSTFAQLDAATHDAAGNLILSGPASGGEYMVKLDTNHATIWGTSFTTSMGMPILEVITELGNGDLLLGGAVNNSGIGGWSMFMARITATGSLVWVQTNNEIGKVTDLYEKPNGNILVMGHYKAAVGDTVKAMILEIDGSGNLQWAKIYAPAIAVGSPFFKSANEWIFPVMGEYYPMLLETDSLGHSGCTSTSLSPIFFPIAMTFSPQTCTAFPVAMAFSPLVTDVVVPQIFVDSCVVGVIAATSLADNAGLSVFPNPTRDHFTLHSQALMEAVQVTNAMGQVVLLVHPQALEQEIALSQSGVYFVKVSTAQGSTTRRVAVLR